MTTWWPTAAMPSLVLSTAAEAVSCALSATLEAQSWALWLTLEATSCNVCDTDEASSATAPFVSLADASQALTSVALSVQLFTSVDLSFVPCEKLLTAMGCSLLRRHVGGALQRE